MVHYDVHGKGLEMWRLGGIGLAVLLAGCATTSPPEGELMLGWARVQGSSMEPVLHDGDVVHVMPVPFEDLNEGDVVVYRIGDELVSHRIYQRDANSWHAKGDANPYFDRQKVTRRNYVGLVYLEEETQEPKGLPQVIRALGR